MHSRKSISSTQNSIIFLSSVAFPAAALFITRTTALLYYLPVLMVSAIGTGIFTGLCAQLVSRRARRAGFLSR